MPRLRACTRSSSARESGSRPVRVETVAGMIFVCLSEDTPDFAPFRAALEPMLEPHELIHAKVAHTVTLIERADWKLVMENARECYHCRAGHPQLMRSFSDFTAPDVSGPRRGLDCRLRGALRGERSEERLGHRPVVRDRPVPAD